MISSKSGYPKAPKIIVCILFFFFFLNSLHNVHIVLYLTLIFFGDQLVQLFVQATLRRKFSGRFYSPPLYDGSINSFRVINE